MLRVTSVQASKQASAHPNPIRKRPTPGSEARFAGSSTRVSAIFECWIRQLEKLNSATRIAQRKRVGCGNWDLATEKADSATRVWQLLTIVRQTWRTISAEAQFLIRAKIVAELRVGNNRAKFSC